MLMRGEYTVRHYRGGILLSERSGFNNVKYDGLKKFMDVSLRGVTRELWYCGLFATIPSTIPVTKTTDLLNTDTTIFTSTYIDTFPRWLPDSISPGGGTALNTAPMIFTITTAGTVRGFYISNRSAKTAGSGVLWATIDFGYTYNVLPDDTFAIIYGITPTNIAAGNMTVEGVSRMLEQCFYSGEFTTGWYVGLMKPITPNTPVVTDVLDTYNSHNWTPVTEITSDTFAAWGPSAATLYTNRVGLVLPTPIVYTFNGDTEVAGIFICNNSNKNMDTGGILLCAKAYNTVKSFSSGDTISISAPLYTAPA